MAAPELPSLSTVGFQGSTKQLCLTQQNREGEAFRQTQGTHGAEQCSGWLQSTTECCVQGAEAASVPGTSWKGKPRAQYGTDNRFAQPAVPCQTTETFMGTQKAAGDISLEEKCVPAEPSWLEPSQRPLLSLSQHCFPWSCPSSSCQLWQGRILHPSALDVCKDLLHPRVQPKPIYTII